ncbi:MAG: radical SAM protein [Planctomycetes bacterium]|jgi:MoaA/NifB/PqqE/SkfB family radical SAM enzyme|nr:radical SAM protein [Planctomycetota bacterium]
MNFPRLATDILKNRINLLTYPRFVTYIVTWRCNGRCTFCDVWQMHKDDTDELTPAETAAIFAQMKRLNVLRLTGGEPFLRNDLAELINAIMAVNRANLIHLTSNGLLTDNIINTLKRVKDIDRAHIKISIDEIGAKHDALRQIPGAFDRALATVKALAELREGTGLHVGVNQVIVNEENIPAYRELKRLLAEWKVPVYPVIANVPTNSLYSKQGPIDPDNSYKLLGQFSRDSLKTLIADLIADSEAIGNFQERLVDRYHLTGLYNRLVKNKMQPNPPCVALKSHLRLLPNGDVPVCLYNGTIVGNLKQEKFPVLWRKNEMKAQREWVRRCPGCWQSCESAVSAIYTGDIARAFFFK